MTHYQILGVSETASQEEIRNAYIQLIKKYHPDLHQDDTSFAEQKTKEINEAYDVLSDKEKREQYDLMLHPITNYNSNYSYTPPKYDYEYNPYTSYSNRYSTYRSSYTTKNTTSRNNTNSHYQNNTDSNYNYYNTEDYIYNKYNSVSIKNKLLLNVGIVILILFIYLMTFVTTLVEFNSSNKKAEEPIIDTPTITIPPSDTEEDDFNINDYFSDSDLRQLYYQYYTEYYDSFAEFKEDFTEVFKEYLNEYY